jgi:hypothetical protein
MIYPNKIDLSKLNKFYKSGQTAEELINSLNDEFADDKLLFMSVGDFFNFFKEEKLEEKYPKPPTDPRPYRSANFGAYFPEFQELLFVISKKTICDFFTYERMFKELKQNIKKIFAHENIHMKQYAQKSKSDTWQGQINTDDLRGKDAYAAYLKEPDEFMAFANSIAHEIYDEFGEEGMLLLNNKTRLQKFNRSYDDYSDILNPKEMRKFHKYIFLYLEDIIKQNEES